MNLESALREIARTLVDAFDVDIQLWMGRAFVRLRETELGASFADWAEANTIVFESLLRVTSAMVRRLPQDSNLVIETIYTQLSRLPVEVKRAVEGEVPRFVMRSGGDKDQFRQRFEEAVTSLSDDDLAKVVRLKSHQLQEWVNSPSKIRPHLLTKWAEQESERREEVRTRGQFSAIRPLRCRHKLIQQRRNSQRMSAKLPTGLKRTAESRRKSGDYSLENESDGWNGSHGLTEGSADWTKRREA